MTVYYEFSGFTFYWLTIDKLEMLLRRDSSYGNMGACQHFSFFFKFKILWHS